MGFGDSTNQVAYNDSWESSDTDDDYGDVQDDPNDPDYTEKPKRRKTSSRGGAFKKTKM